MSTASCSCSGDGASPGFGADDLASCTFSDTYFGFHFFPSMVSMYTLIVNRSRATATTNLKLTANNPPVHLTLYVLFREAYVRHCVVLLAHEIPFVPQRVFCENINNTHEFENRVTERLQPLVVALFVR